MEYHLCNKDIFVNISANLHAIEMNHSIILGSRGEKHSVRLEYLRSVAGLVEPCLELTDRLLARESVFGESFAFILIFDSHASNVNAAICILSGEFCGGHGGRVLYLIGLTRKQLILDSRKTTETH